MSPPTNIPLDQAIANKATHFWKTTLIGVEEEVKGLDNGLMIIQLCAEQHQIFQTKTCNLKPDPVHFTNQI